MRLQSTKWILLLAGVVSILSITPALANGSAKESESSAATRSGRGAVTPTPAAARILQRGYVTNMAESELMLRHLIRVSGGEQVSGDYRVVYLTDPPRGWYTMDDNKLTWRAPAAGENVHLEVVILDSLTGKMLPITPTLDVIDAAGNVVQSKRMNFIWHPLADHYGENYTIPAAGVYTLRVRAPAPNIWRHSRELGNRFTTPVDVEFRNVALTPKAVPAEER